MLHRMAIRLIHVHQLETFYHLLWGQMSVWGQFLPADYAISDGQIFLVLLSSFFFLSLPAKPQTLVSYWFLTHPFTRMCSVFVAFFLSSVNTSNMTIAHRQENRFP